MRNDVTCVILLSYGQEIDLKQSGRRFANDISRCIIQRIFLFSYIFISIFISIMNYTNVSFYNYI